MDSAFVADFLDPPQAHHEAAVGWTRDHGDDPLAVPGVCVFEVLGGSARAGEDRFDRAVGFLRTLDALGLDRGAAIAAGTLDGRLHDRGTPLGDRDMLVAAAALEGGYTLVTRDHDFAAVPELDAAFYDE